MPDCRHEQLRRTGAGLWTPVRVLPFLLLILSPAPAEARFPAPGAGTAVVGRLAGTVEVGPELTSRKIRFSLYPDLIHAADLPVSRPDGGDEIANVVVYFEKMEGGEPAPSGSGATHTMRQEGMRFVPHVLAVRTGSSVEFPNADPIFHNVFSLSRGATFDLGRYPEGRSKSVTFDRPGMVKVFCHIHSDMSAIIMVLDHPFFAIPGADGRYQIDGVPPGAYRVVAWHERVRPLEASVTIEPGHTTILDFKIPLTGTTDE